MTDIKTTQKVFITYAHEDADKRKHLEKCLATMIRDKDIKIWHDAEILAGDKWKKSIRKKLEKSDILIYLISAHSLASESCNNELVRISEKKSDIIVIPVVLEECDYRHHPLLEYEVLPSKDKDIKPISKWNPQSDGWQNVVTGIRNKLKAKSKQMGKICLSSASQETSRTIAAIRETGAEFLFDKANFFLMLGNRDAAILAYTRSLGITPTAKVFINRGYVYAEIGEYDNAISDYSDAIKLNPNSAIAYTNRGVAYKKIGEYDKAIADYDKAIKLNPKLTEAYTNRGNAYRIKGDFGKAISDQNEAIKINPEHVEAYINRGGIYTDKGEYDKGIADLNKAIKLSPAFAQAYHNRGLAYAGKKEYNNAIADYNKALVIDPNLADAYKNRGDSYCYNKEYGNAIESFDNAIELNPNYVQAYNNRGIAYFNKGYNDNAIDDFSEAILKYYEYAKQDMQTALKLARQRGDKGLADKFQDTLNFIVEHNTIMPKANQLAEKNKTIKHQIEIIDKANCGEVVDMEELEEAKIAVAAFNKKHGLS